MKDNADVTMRTLNRRVSALFYELADYAEDAARTGLAIFNDGVGVWESINAIIALIAEIRKELAYREDKKHND